MLLYGPCFGVSFCTVTLSVCLDDTYLGLDSLVATFCERAAHSVNRMFSLLQCMSICSYGFPIWVRGQDLGSDCVSSWSLLTTKLTGNIDKTLTQRRREHFASRLKSSLYIHVKYSLLFTIKLNIIKTRKSSMHV